MNVIEEPAIEINEMNCRFKSVQVLRGATLQVPKGCVYALLGMNGAGKSTLIKAVANLIEPASGYSKILGTKSQDLGVEDWRRIGYVSESQMLPDYLTVGQLAAYCRALYPTWDDKFCERLRGVFGLPRDRKIKEFSRGMKVKASLLATLSYRPAVVILDEPFGGLDVMTRDELIQSILDLSDQENWTVFLTSHDLDEIERLADWVGVIERGVVQISEPLDDLRSRFRRVDVTLQGPAAMPQALPESWILPEVGDFRVRWIESQYSGEENLAAAVERLFPNRIAFGTTPLSLREILIAATRSFRIQPAPIL